MSQNDRVLWSEGLFLQPHHFQQHDRWLEHIGNAQRGLGTPYPWGLSRLALDAELLALGKVGLTDCAGLLPDGTAFDAPASDALPIPLEITDADAGALLYVGLPLRRPGERESGDAAADDVMLRYRVGEAKVRDNTVAAGSEAPVEVGRLDLRLLRESDARAGFACCGVARVRERSSDGKVVLDTDYIPPCIDYRAAARLHDFVQELQGLLRRQAEARVGRIRTGGQGGVSDWGELLLLLSINRMEPLIQHIERIQGLHPEGLYRHLLMLAGELATFADERKRPPDLAPYQHDDLEASYSPLMGLLRDYLSREIVERAVPIPIQERKYGFRIALVTDPSLLADARFVLAGQAQVSSQILRTRFPTQIKIGPIDKIQDMVKLALGGIALRPLPTPPLEIPYHGGFDYFELDRSDALWKDLAKGGGLAMHVGGEFPALQLELWAIRE
jgi:type VI secretion system protein ImpJ